MCAGTLDGQLSFWETTNYNIEGTIDDRLHITGGRLSTDRRTLANSKLNSKYMTEAGPIDPLLESHAVEDGKGNIGLLTPGNQGQCKTHRERKLYLFVPGSQHLLGVLF